MSHRIVNRNRRRGWKYYKVVSRLFLYLGVLAIVGAAPVLIFTLTGQWSALWLLITFLGLSVVFFLLHHHFMGRFRG
jgi:NADH:ubiquinone oxidoreductase subunit 6 (subunit J)